MIYLDLFLGFLDVGCFSFGGAYAAIPLIRDVVLQYGWIKDDTGIGIRFPRFTGRVRDDKDPDMSTSVQEIFEMYEMQSSD